MQILLGVYISLKEMNLNECCWNPLTVARDNLSSFKHKASLLGKATDADGDDISL